MKITLKELLRIDPALSKVLSASLPIKTAFKFHKLIKTLRNDVQALEDTRKGLIAEFGEKMDDGSTMVSADKREAFEEAYEELLSEEVEIDFDPVPVDDLESVSLTANEAFDLEKFIKL